MLSIEIAFEDRGYPPPLPTAHCPTFYQRREVCARALLSLGGWRGCRARDITRRRATLTSYLVVRR